jgi:hypothetical protein
MNSMAIGLASGFIEMDERFCVAVEAAFRSGLESPASASAVKRLGAGDSAPAS